jgi:hypothetical protein
MAGGFSSEIYAEPERHGPLLRKNQMRRDAESAMRQERTPRQVFRICSELKSAGIKL